MSKYRILIRAFTARRDVESSALLARLLEAQGCEVIVASVRNFTTTLKHWKPHAALINTPTAAVKVRKVDPNVKLIFLDGEGYQAAAGNRVKFWMEEPEQYNALDLILIWGKAELNSFERLVPDWDTKHVHISGNPNLDLVRYLPDELKTTKQSNSVGVVCRFPTINHHEGISAIRNLWLEETLEFVVNMCYSYHGVCKAIDAILEGTDLDISIRPHPGEAIETYEEIVRPRYKKEYQKRIHIDRSLGFASWAAQQRALVSPTSTSFLEAYLLGVPVVNIDMIAGTEDYVRAYAQVAKEWQGACVMPKSKEEMIDILMNNLPKVEFNETIEKQLDDFCDWNSGISSCKRTADIIVDMLKNSELRKEKLYVPKWFLRLWDDYRFRQAMRQNRLHCNFNYKEGFHELPPYLPKVCDAILNDPKNN